MIPELTIRYDHDMRPISAECSSCGQRMPAPPSALRNTADTIMWFSDHFIEHRQQKHPAPPYGSSANADAPTGDLT
jgi:hypothetical protein